MNNDLINELYSKIDNQEKIIVDLQKNNSGITLEEHVPVLNAYQELQEKYNKQKEVIDKIKNCFDNGHFEDHCDCLIIEKYIDSYFEEVSE